MYSQPPLYHHSPMPVAFVGDASHASPPNLAQGAAIAIEDAFELALARLISPQPQLLELPFGRRCGGEDAQFSPQGCTTRGCVLSAADGLADVALGGSAAALSYAFRVPRGRNEMQETSPGASDSPVVACWIWAATMRFVAPLVSVPVRAFRLRAGART